MPHCIEITLKPDYIDAEGRSLIRKARDYFGITLNAVRTVQVVTLDMELSQEERERIRQEIFTNPVTQVSSLTPLDIAFDWCIWVGYRPGVRDNPGSTAIEAIEDILGKRLTSAEGVYTSKRYCLVSPNMSHAQADMIAGELLANDIIQQWKIFARTEWNREEGIGFIVPKVDLNHQPRVQTISMESDAIVRQLSDERNLALHPGDIPSIRAYFLKGEIKTERAAMGLSDPTDLELEYISQARSDHCNHNTFQGRFNYVDLSTGQKEVVDNLFKTCIKEPTLYLKEQKDWIVSVLWDNAGAGRFDDQHHYVITGETHNSPSNMEAYGGAITGIVGVYRDPLGTGLASKLIMGSYGYCVGLRDYEGALKPHLHPRRLLDGVIEGVKDGGNKSGIPTPFGQILFHPGYMGKSLVFVTALGLMPDKVHGRPGHLKETRPGDLIIMCGGRVGKDGIHGVTASSEVFTENTPAGHVQIGDPYTQKKMHDFLLEARDEGLIAFITDNGGGGLSSSVGESAEIAGGCHVTLEKVPLKYQGLDQWEIWISESQERMTVAIKPDHLDRFMQLSQKHEVESTVIGNYTDSGKLHITYEGKTCAYVRLDLLSEGFPQWRFEAEWRSPEQRGLTEPVMSEPRDYGQVLKDMLGRPNICSKEWVIRQYDHEVQGTSVVKPLVGVARDVNSDAAVIRPVLSSERGIAFSQALIPFYSEIDAYHMTACTIDEAVRRLIAVGGTLSHMGGVDNFCWPDIQYHFQKNPDAKFKAAQLVRSCWALRDMVLAYEIPLLSGKDSMYIDGHLTGQYGEAQKVSALATLQFSGTSVIDDVKKCVTMDAKIPGDLVYIVGMTQNELGASEYYDLMGFVGRNVPQVDTQVFKSHYQAITQAIQKGLVASVHGIYRGGLGVHLAQVAFAGGLGMQISLADVPLTGTDRNDALLFSESAGRFILTIDPQQKSAIEAVFTGLTFQQIGVVTEEPRLRIAGLDHTGIIDVALDELKSAWKAPFGGLL